MIAVMAACFLTQPLLREPTQKKKEAWNHSGTPKAPNISFSHPKNSHRFPNVCQSRSNQTHQCSSRHFSPQHYLLDPKSCPVMPAL